jgi:hypothetical protein
MNPQFTYSEIPAAARSELSGAIRRESFYLIFMFLDIFVALLAASALADWLAPRNAGNTMHMAVRYVFVIVIALGGSFGLIEPWLRREVVRRFNPNKAQEPTT